MISVLLPTYNSAQTLLTAVNSILHQTVTEFELLVLDDGSTDATAEIVRSVQDTRVKYLQLPHQGLAKTLNDGLSEAQYDIIARMDADDISVPWRFEKQLSVLKQLPHQYLLSCWYGIFQHRSIQYIIQSPTSSSDIKKGLLLYSFISHPGLMFRKNALVANGGYVLPPECDAFEDYATWLKNKDRVEFAIIPEVLIFQRYRKHSLSNDIQHQHKIMYEIQRPYYDDLRRFFNIETEEEEFVYRGWREYFYGDKRDARKFWNNLALAIVKYPKIILAWCITLLPEQHFIRFKEHRIRYRIHYMLRYFSAPMRLLRRTFNSSLTNEIA